jgi:hypothetical protein
VELCEGLQVCLGAHGTDDAMAGGEGFLGEGMALEGGWAMGGVGWGICLIGLEGCLFLSRARIGMARCVTRARFGVEGIEWNYAGGARPARMSVLPGR